MILFFDTETTGIRKNGFIPRVVQIGALLADNEGRTISELNVLRHPEGFDEVPVEASNVHGFTTDMVKEYGISREIGLMTFFELLDKADVLVAHNIEYDLDLMNIEINEFSGDHVMKDLWRECLGKAQIFCTMNQSRDLIQLPLSAAQASVFKDKGITQQYKNPRLTEAYRHFFNEDFEGAHDAMADVRACRDVYFKLHSLKDEVAA